MIVTAGPYVIVILSFIVQT
ncbi:MAG: photosystem II reaction center protein Ycf12 [ANME-2 cluster archaeon]|nr:photosystem II reaction center protein Ycf12 [ANME-2 cluster archaeon]